MSPPTAERARRSGLRVLPSYCLGRGGWDSTNTNLSKLFSAFPRSPRGTAAAAGSSSLPPSSTSSSTHAPARCEGGGQGEGHPLRSAGAIGQPLPLESPSPLPCASPTQQSSNAYDQSSGAMTRCSAANSPTPMATPVTFARTPDADRSELVTTLSTPSQSPPHNKKKGQRGGGEAEGSAKSPSKARERLPPITGLDGRAGSPNGGARSVLRSLGRW